MGQVRYYAKKLGVCMFLNRINRFNFLCAQGGRQWLYFWYDKTDDNVSFVMTYIIMKNRELTKPRFIFEFMGDAINRNTLLP